MVRNLVVCFDGTSAQPRAGVNTNVVRLYGMLDLADPAKQVAYYDPGVGTFAAAGAWTPLARWWSRVMGMAFGSGLKENLGEAYTWLMRTWSVGDQVYVFGFSRGAYNARALVGMLRTLGLMRPGSENLVPYAVAAYSGGLDDMHKMAEIFAQRVDGDRTTVPIRYLGLWDTVKAAGILRRSITWPYTRILPNAQRIRHAVSLDERRRPFREYLIDDPNDKTREEVWFAGIHSDVGGTYADDDELSTIALKWIVDAAVAEGLLVRARKRSAECAVTPASASGRAHRNGMIWGLLDWRRRPVADGTRVHASVAARAAADPRYDAVRGRKVTYVDDGWAGSA
ncbi:DUF2235 domain-containing protein [Microbacterium sp. bgisy203]|uniref:DUF2235 domain-containing protein n=1 Tax=Microbacterium sp. bgisy203 TaxID=3413799 RepID=UPI003D73E337